MAIPGTAFRAVRHEPGWWRLSRRHGMALSMRSEARWAGCRCGQDAGLARSPPPTSPLHLYRPTAPPRWRVPVQADGPDAAAASARQFGDGVEISVGGLEVGSATRRTQPPPAMRPLLFANAAPRRRRGAKPGEAQIANAVSAQADAQVCRRNFRGALADEVEARTRCRGMSSRALASRRDRWLHRHLAAILGDGAARGVWLHAASAMVRVNGGAMPRCARRIVLEEYPDATRCPDR